MDYSVDVVDKQSEFDVIRKAKRSNSYVGIFLLLDEHSYCWDLARCQAHQQNKECSYKNGLPCGWA